jgi:hypothetical protein
MATCGRAAPQKQVRRRLQCKKLPKSAFSVHLGPVKPPDESNIVAPVGAENAGSINREKMRPAIHEDVICGMRPVV